MNSRTAPADKSYPGIELLRFSSALVVLVWHFQHFAYGASGFVIARDTQPFYTFLEPFYLYGAYGVQLFWCISGFVFFHVYTAENAAPKVRFKSFWIKRFARLYPLHLFTLLLVIALQSLFLLQNGYYFVYQHNDWQHLLLQLLMASHWGMQDGYSFNGPIWSVSVEILAYLLFFIWCVTGKWNRALLVTVVGILYWLEQQTILECVLLFFTGGLVHYVNRQSHPWLRRSLVLLLIASSLLMLLASEQAGGFYAISPEMRAGLVLSMCALTVHIASHIQLSGGKRHQAFVLGDLTYSIYLMHFPVQLGMVLFSAAWGLEVNYQQYELFILYLCVTLLMAGLTSRYIESPARRMIRKYS